jgi:hypothetical protein
MTFQPVNSLTSYLPTDLILPEDPLELRRVLDDTLKRLIDAVNDKDIGHYAIITLLNGQKFFTPGDPQNFRNVFRKVIDLGGLNDFTAVNPQNVAHGMTITADLEITRIYGTATDPSTTYIPLPYLDMTGGANHIQLSMDNTNIVLRSNLDYSGFTTAYAIVEWVETT